MFEGIKFVTNPKLRGWKLRQHTSHLIEVSPCVRAFVEQLRRIARVFRPRK
jgi:hypothetical protein